MEKMVQLKTYCTAALRKRVKEAAKRDGRKMSKWIERALEAALAS